MIYDCLVYLLTFSVRSVIVSVACVLFRLLVLCHNLPVGFNLTAARIIMHLSDFIVVQISPKERSVVTKQARQTLILNL